MIVDIVGPFDESAFIVHICYLWKWKWCFSIAPCPCHPHRYQEDVRMMEEDRHRLADEHNFVSGAERSAGWETSWMSSAGRRANKKDAATSDDDRESWGGKASYWSEWRRNERWTLLCSSDRSCWTTWLMMGSRRRLSYSDQLNVVLDY